MSIDDLEETPVNGLVDSRRAAAMLGVSANTFRVWANRSRTAEAGIAAAMPKPVATLHGQVYLAEEVEAFGRTIALNRRQPRSKERALGAYFTPDAAATMMARWALRRRNDVVLEPSLGDGQFAFAVKQVSDKRNWPEPEFHACELDTDTAARALQSGAIESARLHVGDFLAAKDLPKVDVVIGNPPYVRIRELNSGLRRSALKAVSDTMGVTMDPAGSAWMPFVAKSIAQLKTGGRLAFVLPLDFTYVRYARPLWAHLARCFGRVRILRFRERVFQNILQNVLILLAEDKGRSTSNIELIALNKQADLRGGRVGSGVTIPIQSILNGERSFQHALLPEATREFLLLLDEHVERSVERAKFNIGYVSGNKNFFHPDEAMIKRFRLSARSLTPTTASSRQLSRQALRTSEMPVTARLWNPQANLTQGEIDYVTQGEDDGVDMAYKCRIRKPWYRVPGVKSPDLLLTTFSDIPRLHINDANWAASNSVLCGFVRPGDTAETFVSSWYTPLTLLSTEMEVHSLGGGVMIAVPREADAIQIMKSKSTRPIDANQLSSALQSGDAFAAYATGSESLRAIIGKEGLESIWAGIDELLAWRKSQSA